MSHGFTAYCYDHIDNDRVNGRTTIFTYNNIYSSPLQVHTLLWTVAVHMSLLTLTFTICNIYLPLSVPVSKSYLMNVISLLPPVIIVDFNAEHILWHLDHIDDKCTLVAGTSARFNLTLLNIGANMYCQGFGTSFA
jgi:hypothetical protein